MNKGIGFATFLLSMFFVLGLGLLLIYTFHALIASPPQDTLSFSPIVTSKPTAPTLDISSPDDNSLIFDPNILVEGRTTPNTKVLISNENSDQFIVSDKYGNFSQTLKLNLGINNLLITAFNNQGQLISDTRMVFYSKQQL